MGQTATRPLGEIYAETRLRIADLVSGLDEAQLGLILPTCPAWSVRDVVGHMAGLLADVLEKNFEGVGTPEWTQAQVDSLGHLDVGRTLAIWDERATKVESDFPGALGEFSPRLVSDVWNHEQDIRGALHLPRAHRDSDAVPAALVGQMEMLTTRLDQAGLPAMRMVTADGEWQAGSGEPVGRLNVDSQAELLRVLLGRRSRTQIATLDWHVDDLEAYLDVFPRFGPAEQDVHE
jgi:uncharacterized protein (TIGR03083 family)